DRSYGICSSRLDLAVLLGESLDRDHTLVLRRVEHDDAAGLTALDADLRDPDSDQLAAVGDQHELVGFLDRERRHQPADTRANGTALLAVVHRNDALSAAAGGPVLVGRGSFAEAALGDREHELLRGRHFHVALLAELDGAGGALLRLDFRRRLGGLFRRLALAAPHRACALEIGGALLGAGVDMT